MKFIYPHQRYRCIQCCKCCGGWRIWVEPDLVPQLRQHPLALRLEVAGQPYLLDESEGWKVLGLDASGRCYFLEEDGRCGLHASSGWLSKPRACRQFPFFLRETPDGIQIGLSFRCSAVQENMGQEWPEHEADLSQLFQSGQYPRIGFNPASYGSTTVNWVTYMKWERDWLLQLEQATLEDIFYRHLGPNLLVCEFARLLERWVVWACELLQVELTLASPEISQESIRFLQHILERKDLWLGDELLGRMLMLLVGERLLWSARGSGYSWAEVFDLVDGQWLAHREDLGDIQLGMAQILVQFL